MCVYSDICHICHIPRFVLNEMVQTERDYVKDLGVVVEVCGTVLMVLQCTKEIFLMF